MSRAHSGGWFRRRLIRTGWLFAGLLVVAACSSGVRQELPASPVPSTVPPGTATAAAFLPSPALPLTVLPDAGVVGSVPATASPSMLPGTGIVEPAPAASGMRPTAQPHPAAAALPVNILIADRGNNRIIEVTPDKRIVWSFQFAGLRPGHGADDAFFTPGHQTIIAGLEEEHTIVEIDYATKRVIWQYGMPGKPGTGPNQLNTPDDPYRLPDGTTSVADIKNCRVVFISPDKHIVKQYGRTRQCRSAPGYLNKPNGDTPLPNGHMLITEIRDSRISEVDGTGRRVWSWRSPALYPSDAQLTARGTIIVADYSRPGQILELSRTGQVLWKYRFPLGSPQELDRPSLAAELPNGNIIANDDFNHRVVVIDKATKRIVWQYGVTGRPGAGPGELCIPDGVDWRR